MGSCFFLSSDCSPTYFWGFFLASESNAYKTRGKEGKRDRFLFVRDKSESGWMSDIVQTSTFSLLNKLFYYFIDPAFGCVKREKCFLKTRCSMILSCFSWRLKNMLHLTSSGALPEEHSLSQPPRMAPLSWPFPSAPALPKLLSSIFFSYPT